MQQNNKLLSISCNEISHPSSPVNSLDMTTVLTFFLQTNIVLYVQELSHAHYIIQKWDNQPTSNIHVCILYGHRHIAYLARNIN